MIDKKFIQSIMRGVLHKDPTQEDHNLMHPEREWFIGLGVALIVLGAGAFWCVQIYFAHSNSTKIISAGSPVEQTVYREKEVDQALSEFAERKKKHESLRRDLQSTGANNQPILDGIIFPESLEATSTATTTKTEEVLEATTTKGVFSPYSQSAEIPKEEDISTSTPTPR